MFKVYKSASHDYDINNLPHNRKEAFKDIVKQRYKLLTLMGLIFFAFAIVFFVSIYFQFKANYNIANSIAEGNIEYQQAIEELVSYKGVMNLFTLVGSIILLVGLSGLSKVFLKLTYQEGIIFSYDFKVGITQNYKDLALGFLFYYVIYIVFDYISSLILINQLSSLSFIVVIPYILLFAVLLPCFIIYYNLNCIYSDSIKRKIKNAWIIYLKYMPIVILFVLLFVMPLIVFVQPNFIISFVTIFIVCLFILPVEMVGWHLYANKMFDECININFYPEIVDKGLEM